MLTVVPQITNIGKSLLLRAIGGEKITFPVQDSSTFSTTSPQYRLQYDKKHFLKEDVTRHTQQIAQLEFDSPHTVEGQLFGDLTADHIAKIDGVYIDRNSNVRIVATSEGRRLYYMECCPGKQYSIYSESGKTIVVAIIEAPDESALTDGYDAKTSGYSYVVGSNIVTTRDLQRTVQLTAPEPQTAGNKTYMLVQVSTSADYPTGDIDGWYQTVFSRITVLEGEPTGMVRTRRVIPRAMLDDDLIHEPYRSAGERFAVAKANQFRNIKWTPLVAGMKNAKGVDYPSGQEQTGLPYSSVKALNQFIGLDVLLETFVSALHNPNSILYTYNAKTVKAINRYLSSTEQNGFYAMGTSIAEASQSLENAGTYYGTVCSAYTGYCVGLPTYETTYSLLHAPGMVKEKDLSAYGCHRGSIILGQHYRTKGGHVSIVTDVEKSKDGEARFICLSDSSIPVIKSCKKEPQEFFDENLSFSRNGEYSQTTILTYDGIDKNIICEFDVKALRGLTSNSDVVCMEPGVIVLDDRFDRIGCVYYIRSDTKVCVPIYEGDADNTALHWEFTPKYADNPYSAPLLKIVGLGSGGTNAAEGKIVVSPLDTMKSYVVPEWAYNLRSDIALDRGNRSSYRKGESIKVSNLSGGDVKVIIRNADTGAVYQDGNQNIGQVTVKKGEDDITGYTAVAAGQHLVIDTSSIPAGYYTVASEDETKKPLEFLIFDTGNVYISAESFVDGDCTKGVNNQVNGKIVGADLVANGYTLMTPLYVSLTTNTGIVGATSTDVSVSNGEVTFGIDKYEIPTGYNNAGRKFNCLRVHFVTRYGRVISVPCILQTN